MQGRHTEGRFCAATTPTGRLHEISHQRSQSPNSSSWPYFARTFAVAFDTACPRKDYRCSSRVSASPKLSISMPMRSMIER